MSATTRAACGISGSCYKSDPTAGLAISRPDGIPRPQSRTHRLEGQLSHNQPE